MIRRYKFNKVYSSLWAYGLYSLLLSGLFLALLFGGCATGPKTCTKCAETKHSAWQGVHFNNLRPDGIPVFKQAVEQCLAPWGVNTIVLEVGYNFQFKSHPEIASGNGLTHEEAHDLAHFCRAHGIRIIPLMNCLGHQSWKEPPGALLKAHPEFEEIPDIPVDSKEFYCRSWCPLHPDINDIVFDLMDELIDAFEADAFHVGMDEVFIIASKECPRCKDEDPAELFAKAVNDYYRHLVKTKKVSMLMWGDRLLDGQATGYGKWEASINGTAPAIGKIPNDIIICDWHYGKRDDYPSLKIFQDKGFRVWPGTWNKKDAALALLEASQRDQQGGIIGYLNTCWMNPAPVCEALVQGEAFTGPAEAKQIAEVIQVIQQGVTK